MGLNLNLQALSMPSGSEFEGTRQELQNSIAQYLAIAGEEGFTGINTGSTTPPAENRDRPWWKTDGSGVFQGLYYWSGSAWAPIPSLVPSGTFGSAPTGTSAGQLYYAADIKVLCLWNGSSWVTADGAPGEVRFVRGTSSATILTKYPGWGLVSDLAGCALAVAGDGSVNGFSVRAPETHVGEENHTQLLNELVAHSHPYTLAPTRNGTAGANPIWANDTTSNTGATGGGQPFNVMGPTWFLYAIQKS